MGLFVLQAIAAALGAMIFAMPIMYPDAKLEGDDNDRQ
jgi:hypothetical protein